MRYGTAGAQPAVRVSALLFAAADSSWIHEHAEGGHEDESGYQDERDALERAGLECTEHSERRADGDQYRSADADESETDSRRVVNEDGPQRQKHERDHHHADQQGGKKQHRRQDRGVGRIADGDHDIDERPREAGKQHGDYRAHGYGFENGW